MTLLSFCAIMLLPRQFHVSVVENSSDAEVGRARWLFPLYLVAINLFVIPIALAGLRDLPVRRRRNRHVRPGAADREASAPLLSRSASSSAACRRRPAMVIVECVRAVGHGLQRHRRCRWRCSAALQSAQRGPAGFRRASCSGVAPHRDHRHHGHGVFLLSRAGQCPARGDRAVVLRRHCAAGAGIFRRPVLARRATARGAMGGMLVGIAVWIYTLFLPSFLDGNTAGLLLLQHGPFGIAALRPQALFGADLSPLLHGVLWSLSLNLLTYVALSLARQPSSIERLQADLFVPHALAPMTPTFRRWRTTVTVQDIQSTVAQYLGPDRAICSMPSRSLRVIRGRRPTQMSANDAEPWISARPLGSRWRPTTAYSAESVMRGRVDSHLDPIGRTADSLRSDAFQEIVFAVEEADRDVGRIVLKAVRLDPGLDNVAEDRTDFQRRSEMAAAPPSRSIRRQCPPAAAGSSTIRLGR